MATVPSAAVLSAAERQDQRPVAPEVLASAPGILATSAMTIGGHRGMGMNLWSATADRQTHRENTVASFRRAAAAGVSFVEFDVQVTKDGVPVIWHDDTAIWRTSTGALRSAAIADLTLAEFKALSRSNCACSAGNCLSGALADGCDAPKTAAHQAQSGAPHLQRGFYRLSEKGRPEQQPPSNWATTVDDELPTLAEVFSRVPQHIGFDIEIKMTTPDSVERTAPAEVERIVSAVLGSMAYMGTSSRTLIFSSFDPDVCAMLRARQQRIPVFFLSTGGTVPHPNPDRMGLDAAINFALRSNLQGLVVDTSALRRAPQAAATARSKGLQVLTYGLENNDPEWIQQQARMGVAAAIVDDVDRIAPLARNKGLDVSDLEQMEQPPVYQQPLDIVKLLGAAAPALTRVKQMT